MQTNLSLGNKSLQSVEITNKTFIPFVQRTHENPFLTRRSFHFRQNNWTNPNFKISEPLLSYSNLCTKRMQGTFFLMLITLKCLLVNLLKIISHGMLGGTAPISFSAVTHKLDFPLTTSPERLGPVSPCVAHPKYCSSCVNLHLKPSQRRQSLHYPSVESITDTSSALQP